MVSHCLALCVFMETASPTSTVRPSLFRDVGFAYTGENSDRGFLRCMPPPSPPLLSSYVNVNLVQYQLHHNQITGEHILPVFCLALCCSLLCVSYRSD